MQKAQILPYLSKEIAVRAIMDSQMAFFLASTYSYFLLLKLRKIQGFVHETKTFFRVSYQLRESVPKILENIDILYLAKEKKPQRRDINVSKWN